MKRKCLKCRNQLKEGEMICPNCGLDNEEAREEIGAKMVSSVYVGTILCPILGLIFGISGLVSYKNPETRKKYIVAMVFTVVWTVILAFIGLTMK